MPAPVGALTYRAHSDKRESRIWGGLANKQAMYWRVAAGSRRPEPPGKSSEQNVMYVSTAGIKYHDSGVLAGPMMAT
jgi:hypothetical protein